MTYFQFINEAKQISTLYHFTSLNGLEGILDDDEMRSSHGAISFSRNAFLKWGGDGFYSWRVRIAFDGEGLSTRFKLRPVLYDPLKDPVAGDIKAPDDVNWRRKEFGEEREETIPKSNISGIKKYIRHIDVIVPAGAKPADVERLNAIEQKNPALEIRRIKSFSDTRRLQTV